MGIFSSLLSFAIVIGAGYATIKYIVPYLQKEMGGTNIGGQVSGTEGSADEAGAVLENLADAIEAPPPTTTEEKPKRERKKKAPYDASKGMAGKGESRKKKRGGTAKTEYNIFEYDDYDYEDEY
jgi:hypothetical protein